MKGYKCMNYNAKSMNYNSLYIGRKVNINIPV